MNILRSLAVASRSKRNQAGHLICPIACVIVERVAAATHSSIRSSRGLAMDLEGHLSRRAALRVGALGLGGCLATAGSGTWVGAQPSEWPAGTNWAGNVRCTAKEFEQPSGVAEVRQIVRERPRVHAVGGRHSFSPIADTEGAL